MSRSIKKNPVFGVTGAPSEKWSKVMTHRRLRRMEREAISSCVDWDDLLIPLTREISSVWYWPKDGKVWYSKYSIEYLPRTYLKYLRK